MEQTELTPIALYDEAEAQRIVKLIKEVDSLPSGATGKLWVATSRASNGTFATDRVSGLVYFVGVTPDADDENTICVFRRFEPDHGGKPTQEVFKPGAWVQQLEALPEKLRQQEAEKNQRREEEKLRKLADAFAPIDDAAIFEPQAASPAAVATQPEPLPAKKLLYLKVSNDLENAADSLNALVAKGYEIESVVAFPTYNNHEEPDFALFVLKLSDY